MIQIVLYFVELSVPIFFSTIVMMVLYLVVSAVFENIKWLEEMFFFTLLLLITPDIIKLLLFIQSLTKIIASTLLALVPTISSILLLLQGIIAILALNPFVLLVIQWIVFLIDKLLLPALTVAIFLDVWTRAVPSIPFTRFAQFIRSSLMITIGIFMLTLTMMFTISSAVIITLNETISTPLKRMLEQSIPIVGSVIVQVLSLVKKSQIVTSSAIGAASLLTVFAILAIPILYLLSKALLYRLLSIICEPFMPSSITGLLDDISKNLFILCGIVAIVFSSIVFIIMFILLCSYFVLGSVS